MDLPDRSCRTQVRRFVWVSVLSQSPSANDLGALGLIDCLNETCSQGMDLVLVNNSAYFASMIVPRPPHPLDGVPIIFYSRWNSAISRYQLESIYCFDGNCSTCEATDPQPPLLFLSTVRAKVGVATCAVRMLC